MRRAERAQSMATLPPPTTIMVLPSSMGIPAVDVIVIDTQQQIDAEVVAAQRGILTGDAHGFSCLVGADAEEYRLVAVAPEDRS